MTGPLIPALALLGYAVVAGGCADSDAVAPRAAELRRARMAWQSTRAACGGVYHYGQLFISWTGQSTLISVEVSGDRPTRRDMEIWQSRVENQMVVRDLVKRTTESASDLAAAPEAQRPRTMEQLYDLCEHDVLARDPAKNAISFDPPADGVLLTCHYTPKECADDCTVGAGVGDFACGPLP